eukprot:CAMPEP_0178381352 /NCGR_PEP_ID=MMETSP0689_2-20121128/5935_1 /TAXON_ID=160604 /ORGANISM="Amphidinium massartii, Strain CS-259" /LENGTH=302 /DNA_ID=CAMNT_0020001525 /DNA_START=106 /DNA_END=1014 /DNA_ORIENTATION=-
MDELMKFTLCSYIVISTYFSQAKAESSGPSIDGLVKYFKKTVITWDGLTMAVPALLYTVQKNLLYVALTNLDACIYQVAYQAKILTTAVFSCILLRTQLSRQRILSLLMLMSGVALVEVAKLEEDRPKTSERPVLGLIAVSLACCTSGFAGVFFEYKLKMKSVQQTSLWVRNLQLAFFAGLIAVSGVFIEDWRAVREAGFFQGYDWIVMLTITFEAGGGIIVALVVKYADNIAKNFATGLSLTLTTALSALLWDFHVSTFFVLGAVLTLSATYLYSTAPAVKVEAIPIQAPNIDHKKSAETV